MRLTFFKIFDVTELRLQKIQTFLQRHLGPHGDLKVLASVIALVVFNLIRTTIGHPETYTAPVHTTINEKGVAILRYSPAEVEIELKGSADDIKNFDPVRLMVEVDVGSAFKENKTYVKLLRSQVAGAGKLRVGRITPPGILVEYDQEVEMTLRLKEPELLGKPLQGEASVELMSNEVKVTGPESQLQILLEKSILLPTDPVDVSGKTQGFIKRVKVLPPDDSGISHVTPTEVEARIYITIVPPSESIYTNVPTPTVTNRTPPTVKAITNDLTNATTVSTEGGQELDAEPFNSEINAESK